MEDFAPRERGVCLWRSRLFSSKISFSRPLADLTMGVLIRRLKGRARPATNKVHYVNLYKIKPLAAQVFRRIRTLLINDKFKTKTLLRAYREISLVQEIHLRPRSYSGCANGAAKCLTLVISFCFRGSK